ncbi:hypothetical protein ACGFJT_37420 [Actinomadura geliboluensis]|uniref:hypothetical protein n=1 Tax=Actinomadura geliboluensis TaxID=882440 RepID=UPI003719BBCF
MLFRTPLAPRHAPRLTGQRQTLLAAFSPALPLDGIVTRMLLGSQRAGLADCDGPTPRAARWHCTVAAAPS